MINNFHKFCGLCLLFGPMHIASASEVVGMFNCTVLDVSLKVLERGKLATFGGWTGSWDPGDSATVTYKVDPVSGFSLELNFSESKRNPLRIDISMGAKQDITIGRGGWSHKNDWSKISFFPDTASIEYFDSRLDLQRTWGSDWDGYLTTNYSSSQKMMFGHTALTCRHVIDSHKQVYNWALQ